MCGRDIDCERLINNGEGHHEDGPTPFREEEALGYDDHCHYEHYFSFHEDHGNELVTIAEENGWDMNGFIADYTHYEIEDNRIDDEFMAFVYDIVCCRQLDESLGAIMRLNKFTNLSEVDAYN